MQTSYRTRRLHLFNSGLKITVVMVVYSLSCVRLLRSHALSCQAPLSMEFSRQEYWSALPFPSPGDLPDPGIKLTSPALQVDSLPLRNQGSQKNNSKRERWALSLHGYRVPVLQDDVLENCCTIIWIYLTTELYIMDEVVHFKKYIYFYLFYLFSLIWLYQVLVAACKLLVVACGI